MIQEDFKTDIATLERLIRHLKRKLANLSVVEYQGVFYDGYRKALDDMINEIEHDLIRRKHEEMDIVKLNLEHWGERFHPLSGEEIAHLALRAVMQALEKEIKKTEE